MTVLIKSCCEIDLKYAPFSMQINWEKVFLSYQKFFSGTFIIVHLPPMKLLLILL